MKNLIRPKATPKIYASSLFAAIYTRTTQYIKISHLLIFLFGYTAISKLNLFSYSIPFTWEKFKLIDTTSFREAMLKSAVLRPYVNELAYLIPFGEIAICLLLVFTRTKKTGYYLSLLAMVLFTVYIIYILAAYANNLPCICGGVISMMSWKQHLLFNLFFILITIRAIYLTHKQQRQCYKPV